MPSTSRFRILMVVFPSVRMALVSLDASFVTDRRVV
jgi:hypothetical protein